MYAFISKTCSNDFHGNDILYDFEKCSGEAKVRDQDSNENENMELTIRCSTSKFPCVMINKLINLKYKIFVCNKIRKWITYLMIKERTMLSPRIKNLRIQKLAAKNKTCPSFVWAFAWPKMKLALEVFEHEDWMLAPNTSPWSRNAFKMDFHWYHKHAADGTTGAANLLSYSMEL